MNYKQDKSFDFFGESVKSVEKLDVIQIKLIIIRYHSLFLVLFELVMWKMFWLLFEFEAKINIQENEDKFQGELSLDV